MNSKPTPDIYLALPVICFFGICLSLGAQQTPVQRQFEHLAEQTAKKVAKTDGRRILTTPLSGCLGALDSIGYVVGAEVVIGEDFQRNRDTCHLHTTVTDAKHHYALGDFSTDVPCTVATKTKLSLLKDPTSGVFLIVPLPELPAAPTDESHIVYPSCLSCPDPHYTGDAKARGIQGSVRILITVTDQGAVENAKGLGAVEVGLGLASIRAVSGWRLKPAVGPDGKPFPARVPVEVTFRLLP